MKNFYILIVIMIMLVVSCKEKALSKVDQKKLMIAKEKTEKAKQNLPVITFVSKEYDFGKVKEGEVIYAVYEFENTGKSDLVITNATATCGCTVPEWPKNTPIKPGEKGLIKARFNTKGKPNKQNKSITLRLNTKEGREVLQVKGFVIPDPNTPERKPKYPPKTLKNS